MTEQPTEPPRISQHAQEIRRLQSACLRALSADAGLELRGNTAWSSGRMLPINAAHLYPQIGYSDLHAYRGASDGMALRVRHSDMRQHQELLPKSSGGRFIFELLEQFRCESLNRLPGVSSNLDNGFHSWTTQFQASALAETELGQMLFALAQVCRSKINGTGLAPEMEDSIEAARIAFPSGIGALAARLRPARFDQLRFAQISLPIASLVDDSIAAHHSNRGSRPAPRRRADDSRFTLHLDVAGEAAAVARAALDPGSKSGREDSRYRAFTRQYDQVVPATQHIRAGLLERYRAEIAHLASQSGINHRFLARALRAIFCYPTPDGWYGGAERGLIDGGRLATLIASPTDHRVFRETHEASHPFAAISFLIDCSGSMRHHAKSIASFLNLTIRALDQCEVPVEVLGYTTRAWNGGRPLSEWRRAGSPQQPGRLNEINHLIFKDFTSSWRTSRNSIGALLHQPLYKEGVDGEAVRWALHRLSENAAERRVLIVISDGSPSDTATTQTNGASYLHQDLVEVIRHANTSRTSVAGIGLGLDMSPYFGDQAVVIEDCELSSDRGIRAFLSLLARLPTLR
ncbi:cobaltochelatase CobT-related protein [Glutamicibacter creatinolyticus]|uniref:cobaltochelatase CobT-related protein n=1 Tax=Glutamicibacter creatinolyticus TaxID=162496 RepID=UPI003B97ECDF